LPQGSAGLNSVSSGSNSVISVTNPWERWWLARQIVSESPIPFLQSFDTEGTEGGRGDHGEEALNPIFVVCRSGFTPREKR
jgi:hypothetical protein